MRLASITGVACAAGLLLGCASGGEDTPAPPRERVHLQVTAPADGATVRGGNVEVGGTVSPSTATVTVLGRPALVSDGRFTVVVPVDPGTTIVDVAAGAPRRRAAFATVRVKRDVLVTVPDLAGVVEGEIDATLEPLGLRASVQRDDGILDVLRPGDRVVCEQDPAPGDRVRRGRTVRVIVAKRC